LAPTPPRSIKILCWEDVSAFSSHLGLIAETSYNPLVCAVNFRDQI
jgi:hypothetical protein